MKYGDATLGQVEAVWNKLGGVEGVARFLAARVKIVPMELLKHVSAVEVLGAAKFVAANHFKVGTASGVKIGWLSNEFKEFFLGKTEESVDPATLTIHRLIDASLDAPIMAELGPRTETSLAELFALFQKQGNGENGLLLTNGCANIFYIRGTDGNLWAVGAFWHCDSWYLDARSVEFPCEWTAEDLVVSR